jgi:two-component system, NarL family, nitrate/nitrite response regulator NarL
LAGADRTDRCHLKALTGLRGCATLAPGLVAASAGNSQARQERDVLGTSHGVGTPSPFSPSRQITVFLVATVRLYREGLADALEREDGIRVVQADAEVGRFFDDPPCEGADVALLDMTVDGSLAAVQRASSLGEVPRIVAVAIPDDDHQVIACAEAGVHGYVTCDEPLSELTAAVRSAARGEARCSPRVAAVLLHRVRALRHVASPGAATHLTSRELEVVALIAQGLSNKEIAARLKLGLPTVKNHVHNILGKLGVSRRGDVVRHVWSGGPAARQIAPVPAGD